MKIDSATAHINANQLSSIKSAYEAKSVEERNSASTSLGVKESSGQGNSLKSLVNQIDKVDLTLAAADAAALELEESRVYHGKERIVIMPQSEKTDRMDAVIKRLDAEQQQTLIDSNMLVEDDFLALAETLSDEALRAFTHVIDGLQTLPKLNNFPTLDITGFTAAKGLVDTLSSMDESTRSRVLEQASLHADKVARYEGDETYLPNGQLFNQNSSSTANDLHNFVSAVNLSDDVNAMLDDMAQFSESQQSDLLHILGSNVEMGSRLMASLEGRESKAQDAMLNMLSEVAQSAQGYAPDLAPLGVSGNVSAILDHDNNSGRIVWQMVDDTVSLMEAYEFSDEQLEQMGGQLAHMSRSDQRAYISISTVGLEHLVGAEEGKQIDLAEHEAAFETIESLQNNASVRDEVFKARMGEEIISDGRRFYALKEEGESVRDQAAMIELLATDAWMNQDKSASEIRVSSTQLVNALGQLGAEERDELVTQLNGLNEGDIPLTQRSLSALQEDNQGLIDRIDTLTSTESVEVLLETEALISEEQEDDFWHVTALAEDNVDPLLELLQQSGADMREQIIAGLALEADRVSTVGQSSEVRATAIKSSDQGDGAGTKSVEELISFFNAEETSERDKLNYLNRLQQ